MVRKTKAESEQTRIQILEAARRVFHRKGVARSNLEAIAQEAGVTRGAVYHHFSNKAEVFFAMREHTVLPLFDRVDDIILDQNGEDPLAALGCAIVQILRTLHEDEAVRQVFEIMFLRYEYVGEFADALRPRTDCACDCIQNYALAYQRAQEKGLVSTALDPKTMATDTFFFMHGLVHFWVAHGGVGQALGEIEKQVSAHLALRRVVNSQALPTT